MKRGKVKYHQHAYKTYLDNYFIWIITLFDEALNLAMVRNFEVMLGQTINLSVQNSVILAMPYVCKLLNVLLNNVRKVGGLVLSRTSWFSHTVLRPIITCF
jgi:hypothetical protein